ncbi:MAG: glycosyltransferase [Cyanobacteria bacterium P01_H01_bin.105]
MTATRLSPCTAPTVPPSITLIISPRESFSYTQQSLDSIYQHTRIPFELVYIDAGSPKHIQKYLKRAAAKEGFTLLRSDRFLSPNQARNLGLSQAITDYVVFIDNNIHVSPGWLEHLWYCAQETNATVVCPLTCVGKPLHDRIHLAGGEARIFMNIKGDRLRRHLYEKRFLVNRSAAAIKSQLHRRSCELAELRCTLVKREIFDKIGPFDEKLLGAQADIDFCLSVNQTGRHILCEPASVVTHVSQSSYHWSDLVYFMLRWSDTWEVKSLMYFQQKWDLDMDHYFLHRYQQLGHHRRKAFLYPVLRWLTGNRKIAWLENLAIQLEQWMNQIITDRHAQLPHTPIKKLAMTSSSDRKISAKQQLQQSVLNSHNTTARLSQPRLMSH